MTSVIVTEVRLTPFDGRERLRPTAQRVRVATTYNVPCPVVGPTHHNLRNTTRKGD